jgi:hypothetical protein
MYSRIGGKYCFLMSQNDGYAAYNTPTPSPFCIVRYTYPLAHSNHLARLVLSTENARYVPAITDVGNPRFFLPVCVENICFDGFSLTESL